MTMHYVISVDWFMWKQVAEQVETVVKHDASGTTVEVTETKLVQTTTVLGKRIIYKKDNDDNNNIILNKKKCRIYAHSHTHTHSHKPS